MVTFTYSAGSNHPGLLCIIFLFYSLFFPAASFSFPCFCRRNLPRSQPPSHVMWRHSIALGHSSCRSVNQPPNPHCSGCVIATMQHLPTDSISHVLEFLPAKELCAATAGHTAHSTQDKGNRPDGVGCEKTRTPSTHH